MKNYCINFVSIKNLSTKEINNINTIKGGGGKDGNVMDDIADMLGSTNKK